MQLASFPGLLHSERDDNAAAHPDDECGYFNVLRLGFSCLPLLLKDAAVVVQGGSECPRLRECVFIGLYHVWRECCLVMCTLCVCMCVCERERAYRHVHNG